MKVPNVGKINVKSLGKHLKTGWNKNNQKVLACLTILTGGLAIIEAVKATPKAMVIREGRKSDIDVATKELQDGTITQEEFRKKTLHINLMTAKEYACCYGTTACLFILSAGSTAFNYKISIGKQAALLGAYKALEARSGEFMDKAKEVVGEKKIDAIKTSVVKDHLNQAEIPEGIKAPEYEKDADGNFLAKQYMYPCWEDESGRPFMSSVSTIDTAMRKASARCFSRDSITLNEIYEFLDPNGMYLFPNGFGETHGFISSQLNSDKLIPYHTRPVDREGFDHSFTAIIFDTNVVLLTLDEDY